MKRFPWLIPVLLGLVAFALASCSNGGAGGADESREPTDEEVREAEDALANEEQQVNDAVDEAIREIEDLLGEIQPCEPTPLLVGQIYQPVALLQQTGHPDADATLDRVNSALAPLTKAIARAWANGELQAQYPDITGEDVVNWARNTGIDHLKDGWMEDPNCQVRWRIDGQYVANITGDAPMDLVHVGSVEFTTYQGGPIAANGPMGVTASGSIPSAGCTVTWDTEPGELSVDGQWLFAPNGFEVTVTFGPVAYTPNLVCPFGATPVTTETSAPFDVHVTLAATDGYVHSEPWSAATGSGEMRFTVTKLN